MEVNFDIQELKKEYHNYCLLHNRLKQAKNQKLRDTIERELNWKKDKMIKNFDLLNYNFQINHYKMDDVLFRRDVGEIISFIEAQA